MSESGGHEEQTALFESDTDSDEIGYRGATACAATGITYRQLDYWARTNLLVPSIRNGGRVGQPAAVLVQGHPRTAGHQASSTPESRSRTCERRWNTCVKGSRRPV